MLEAAETGVEVVSDECERGGMFGAGEGVFLSQKELKKYS